MQKEEIDWINNPHSLVGERIQVLWKGGKKYGGLVKKYSITSKIFTGQYDDGEGKTMQHYKILYVHIVMFNIVSNHTSYIINDDDVLCRVPPLPLF